MGFGRKWLAGVLRNEDLSPEEKEKAIMDEHIAVTDSLKDERDGFKAEAEKAADLQKQLDGINGGEDYKAKWEKEHQAFEDFKKKTADDAEAAKVQAAYRSLLVDEKIGAKRIDSIIRVTDFSKMKLDKDGKLVNESELRKSIGDEWGEFRTTITEKGAKVENPPKTDGGKMTREQIMQISDTTARQKAIAENLDLFQKG